MSVSSQIHEVRARLARALSHAGWASVADDVRAGADLDRLILRISGEFDAEDASEPIAIIQRLRVMLGVPDRLPGGCTFTPSGGPSISVRFMPEHDRWEVSIDTKEMDARSGEAEPVLLVTLNGTDFYDHGRPGFEESQEGGDLS